MDDWYTNFDPDLDCMVIGKIVKLIRIFFKLNLSVELILIKFKLILSYRMNLTDRLGDDKTFKLNRSCFNCL